jgi:hypothetical protein
MISTKLPRPGRPSPRSIMPRTDTLQSVASVQPASLRT